MLVEIFLILFTHWVADFVFQAEEWATNKNKSVKVLLKHTTVYSLIWFLPVAIGNLSLIGTTLFVLITFIAHTITDYFTSKIVSRMFAQKKFGTNIPNRGAFTVIGFDQFLHYAQLFVTYKLIFG